MSNRDDDCNDLIRLQRALAALAADLDAIERRPHLLLRYAAENSQDRSDDIEGFIGNFAVAVEKARLGT